MSEERKKCSYPMSEFYTYEDEIPTGVRVSIGEDCIKCTVAGESLNECEDNKHCLITEK